MAMKGTDYSQTFVMENGKPVHVSKLATTANPTYQQQQQQYQKPYGAPVNTGSQQYYQNTNSVKTEQAPYYQQQAQQQQQQPYANQGSYGGGYDEDDYSDDDYNEPYTYSQQQQQQQYNTPSNQDPRQFSNPQQQIKTPIPQGTTGVPVNTTQQLIEGISYEEMNDDARLPFDKITYYGTITTTRGKMFTKEGNLINSGKVSFSTADGTLKTFAHKSALPFSSNANLNGGNIGTSTKGTDLVKHINVTLTSENFKSDCVLGFPTIGPLETERYQTGHVSTFVDASSFTAQNNFQFKDTITRPVTFGVILFAKNYAMTSPKDIFSKIIDIGQDRVLVNYETDKNPLIHFLNLDNQNNPDAQINAATVESTGQVMLRKDVAMHYAKKAESAISNNMSLGDVSNNLVIEVSAPQPSHKTKNFFGLADFKGELAKQAHLTTREEEEKWIRQYYAEPITFRINVEFTFLSLGTIHKIDVDALKQKK